MQRGKLLGASLPSPLEPPAHLAGPRCCPLSRSHSLLYTCCGVGSCRQLSDTNCVPAAIARCRAAESTSTMHAVLPVPGTPQTYSTPPSGGGAGQRSTRGGEGSRRPPWPPESLHPKREPCLPGATPQSPAHLPGSPCPQTPPAAPSPRRGTAEPPAPMRATALRAPLTAGRAGARAPMKGLPRRPGGQTEGGGWAGRREDVISAGQGCSTVGGGGAAAQRVQGHRGGGSLALGRPTAFLGAGCSAAAPGG
jgi:hypothetical protein